MWHVEKKGLMSNPKCSDRTDLQSILTLSIQSKIDSVYEKAMTSL